MEDEKLKQLKERFGELISVEYSGVEFFFRKPGRIEYKRYYDKLLESVYDASYVLVLDLVVVPTRDQSAAFIEQDPTMPVKVASSLTGFFGSTVAASQKI